MEILKKTIEKLSQEIDNIASNPRYIELKEKHREGKITAEENMELNTYYQTHTRLLIAYNGLFTKKAIKDLNGLLILSFISLILSIIGLII